MICEHGTLTRKCETCDWRARAEAAERERDAALSRVAELEKRLTTLEQPWIEETMKARADCVSLREAAHESYVLCGTCGACIWGADERLKAALQSPHPGQAILDRLARADAVVEAIANMPCALQRAAEVVGMTTDEKCRRCESCMARAYKGTTRGEER